MARTPLTRTPNKGGPALTGSRISVREEKIGEVIVRHKLTSSRALGGLGLLIVFVLGLAAVAAAVLLPEVHSSACALLLVLFLLVLMKGLEAHYRHEVNTRIQDARESFRLRTQAHDLAAQRGRSR